MRQANEIDWPLPCELSEDEHHEQMRKLLDAVRHCIHDNPDVLTLAQAAARQGVSVEEVRDDARKWPDTDARALRILVRLKAKLHDRILAGEAPGSRAAVRILELDLRERQLSSDNRVMVEGTGIPVKIINFADVDGGETTESALTE